MDEKQGIMFNNMKNKIREKTGSDLPKFALGQIQQKLGRHSRQGSETSLSSVALDEEGPTPIPSPPASTPGDPPPLSSLQPDNNELTLADGKSLTSKDLARLAKKEDEWRNRMEKRDLEWNRKMQKRENELTRLLEDKEREWRKQEHALTEDLLRLTRELKDALKVTEEYKRKMVQYQEDKDQLEGFQTQELAKIKHLLLAKEQENAENATALKESTGLVDNLKSELNRLRPFEEQISNFQDDIECLRHSSEKERWLLSSQLAQAEETVRHLRDRVAVLTCRSEAECVALGANLTSDERVQALLGERALLERRLEEAHVHLSDIKASWSGQIAALETQVGRLSRQAGEEGSERRRAEERIAELESRLDEEQNERKKLISRLDRVISERDNLAEELKSVAHDVGTTKSENIDLCDRIIDADKRCLELQSENQKLLEELNAEKSKTKEEFESVDLNSSNLLAELSILKVELQAEKQKTESLEDRLLAIQKERDEAQLRNAQISQDMQLTRQQLSSQQQDSDELNKSLNNQLEEKIQELEHIQAEFLIVKENQIPPHVEQELQTKVIDLEVQLSDKNKMVRVLQQRLNDLKKTLQRELKASDPGGGIASSGNIVSGNSGNSNIETGGSNGHKNGKNGGSNKGAGFETNHNNAAPSSRNSTPLDDEVNFKYLKHVLIKFLTSKEYEAQHLTRAVATLLKFSPEEERLLRDTLEWKMSWFGSRPHLPKYKTISDS